MFVASLAFRSTVAAVAVVVALNVAVHFVPFERRGLEPDDYGNLRRASTTPGGQLAEQALAQPDRPLNWWFVFEVARWAGQDRDKQLLAVVVASSTLAVCVLALFAEIAGSVWQALSLTVLFVLWPAHHAMYGTLMSAGASLIYCLFLVSATLFLRFARRGGGASLAGSLLLYACGMLAYEVGLLTPLVAWGVARRQDRPRHRWALAFAVVAVLVMVRRLALAGAVPALGPTRVASVSALLLNVFWVLPAHFVGHIAARNVLYGLWGFLQLREGALLVGLGVAALTCVASPRILRMQPRLARADLLALGAALVAMAAPACLLLVESRHTALASVAFAPLLGQALLRLSDQKPRAAAALLGALAMISSGLALRQAQAGRLSEAVQVHLQRCAAEGSLGRTVVFDMASFAEAVPATWRPKPYDVMRTYWGLHVFAPWGFREVLGLVAKERVEAVTCAEPVEVSAGRVRCPRLLADEGPERAWIGSAETTSLVNHALVCGPRTARCPP